MRSLIGIIADDLTGCGDIGYFLAVQGIRTRIIVTSDFCAARPPSTFGAVAVSTNSRTISARSAYTRVFNLVTTMKRLGITYIFKKIDSTLRGNIGPEMDAFIDALDITAIPLVAAFPSMGRTTRNGVHYVHGRILEESVFGNDPCNRIISSHIPTLLRVTSKNREHIHVFDAVNNKTLHTIVQHNPSSYYAGSSGFFEYVLKRWI
ncbi:MAG: hypothetical protein GF384_06805 [Elusimicrobia bacterium]|nr:hypothetical protein [Elusimicrobiota bacterium]MBD3412410.1 hypothetical protein [Elusimicrobiota bacterium]